MGRIRRFVFGQPGWSDYLFRSPPRQPDARTVYLGGAGLITALRGAQTLWGTSPQAYLFQLLGVFFVQFWGWAWIVVGTVCVAVAATGHRHPDWDRLAAFAMLMLWWLWGLIYLFSGIFAPSSERRSTDFITAGTLILTGLVLSAGVIQGLRKTHEIFLRQLALDRIRELEEGFKGQAAEIVKLQQERKRLKEELVAAGGRDHDI